MLKESFSDFGLHELNYLETITISGGTSPSYKVGEFVGWVFGCATNAAEILNGLLVDAAKGMLLDKALHK